KVLNIKATATCDNFSNYTIHYGTGFEPISWTLLNSSNIEANDELIYSLNTSTLGDNDYTLRLVVNSKVNSSVEDRFFTEVDSIYINYPENNHVIMNGNVLQINGSSDYHDFINYTLSYGEGSNPSQWLTNNITLVNNGSVSIDNGTLGTWNISMSLQGVYTIKLTVNYLGGEENSTVSVSSDDFMDGWGSDLHQHLNIRIESPVIDDIDGDGDMEVIVSTHENIYGETVNDCRIYVFYGNGTTYPGWPQTTGGCIPGVLSAPAIGDIDRDGYKEIAVTKRGGGSVYMFQYNGTTYPGWPKTIGEDIEGYGPPVFADINKDNYLDILVNSGYYMSGGHSTIYILNKNGTAVSGWPKDLSQSYSYLSNIAVADINNDGSLDIISSSYSSTYTNLSLDVFNSNGTYLSGFPIIKNVSATNWALPPRIADLDLDGDLEIVMPSTEKIYVYHNNGTNFTGWPIAFTLAANFIISDINNDTFPEIIMPHTYANNDDENVLYVYHRNGSVLSGWPQGFNNSSMVDDFSVADIYGDGKQEIIWADRDSKKIYGFYSNGSKIGGFPKITNLLLAQQTVNALGDLDNDGGIEMVGGGYGLFVWDFSSNGTAYHEWNQHSGNPRHDGHYRNKNNLPTSKNFNGKTTEFFYEKDISSVNNSVLEVRGLARVEFNSSINYTSLNLDGNLNLSNRDIIVNETILGRLNKSANITLFNITLDNPVVFINNSECNSSTCTNISYNSSSEIFIFKISSFQTLMLKNVDIVPPDVTISSPSGTSTSRSINISFILDEIGYCDYSLNGGLKNNTLTTFNSLTFTGTNSSIADGNYTINAYCNDSVGNRNDSVSGTFAISASAPPIVTINNPSGTLTTNSFTINITLNEEGYCIYSLNRGLKNNTLTNLNNLTFTGTNSSIADGSYTINAYCNDSYGNRNDTTNKTFAISASVSVDVIGGNTGGTGGGGGGGGGGTTPSDWTNTFTYDSRDLSSMGIVSKLLAVKERIKLSVDKEIHYVGILSIVNSIVLVQVSSTPQSANFNVGDIKKFEINGDGYYDLSITLTSITNGKAVLDIGYVRELIPVSSIELNDTGKTIPSNQTETGTGEKLSDWKNLKFWIILGLISISLVALLIIFLLRRLKLLYFRKSVWIVDKN
ncbi:MAG: VCBS repeat-containing protein, partial [archaeon]|nr:VCBS repeat-containing protein [archaeon]